METVTIPRDALEMEIVIGWDVVEHLPVVRGCDKNPLLALAMLEYVLNRVRRHIVQIDVTAELQNAPRIQVASRLVE